MQKRGLGSFLVTFVVTQNLVSIVCASSSASRDVPLRCTFALDPLELTRSSPWLRAFLGQSRMEKPPRSGAHLFFWAVLYGLKQAPHNRSAFWDRHSLHQKRVPNKKTKLKRARDRMSCKTTGQSQGSDEPRNFCQFCPNSKGPQSALRLSGNTTAPYIADIPPSTLSSDPVTNLLSSLARYTAA
jgi:hypothetical protein